MVTATVRDENGEFCVAVARDVNKAGSFKAKAISLKAKSLKANIKARSLKAKTKARDEVTHHARAD